MSGLDSRVLYLGVVLAVVAERGVELALSRRNLRRALRAGGREVGAAHYPWMVLLHVGLLVACPLEVWFWQRPWIPALAWSMGALLLTAMVIRYWVVKTLGDRWTTRVVWVPGRSIETGGPYRWFRHPNYLAVCLEMVALPLLHTAWVTALVFSLANASLLRLRVRTEEQLLAAHGPYRELFEGRAGWWSGGQR